MEPDSQTTKPDLFENLRLELRRGCLIVAVLAQLRDEHYGYALRKALADQGLAIDENTLYPLLRRLESQGLLVSHWREQDKRHKRFYQLSPDADQILRQLLAEWRDINDSLNRIAGRGLSSNQEQEGPDAAPRHLSQGRGPLPAGRGPR